MPGEESKSSGEYGEKVVHELLKIFGWKCPVENTNIQCYLGTKHKTAGSDRKTHGIDNIFQYACPLRYGLQQNLVISVKNRKKYPSNPMSDFKSFLKDIAYALECFSLNSDWQRNIVSSQIVNSCNWGLIFWFAYEELPTHSIIDLIGDFNNTDDLQYDTVFLVDNKRANFLYSSYMFAHSIYPNNNITYYYPSTTYNMQNPDPQNSGDILPVQYVNSSVIPFKISDGVNNYLLITLLENFTEDTLRRIIGLSQNLTRGWASKTIIAFPDYHEQDCITKVNKIKAKFNDKNFISNLYIRSYPQLNIKSLEENQNV